MKPVYANARQKEALVMFLACAQFLDQGMETSLQGAPKASIADLKRARTYAWKGATAWLKSLNEKAKNSVLNIVKDSNIAIVTAKQGRNAEIATRLQLGIEELVRDMDKQVEQLESDQAHELENVKKATSEYEKGEAFKRHVMRRRQTNEYKRVRDVLREILEKSSIV